MELQLAMNGNPNHGGIVGYSQDSYQCAVPMCCLQHSQFNSEAVLAREMEPRTWDEQRMAGNMGPKKDTTGFAADGYLFGVA